MENNNLNKAEICNRVEAFADYVFEIEKERFDKFCIDFNKTAEEKTQIELGFRMGCISAVLMSEKILNS